MPMKHSMLNLTRMRLVLNDFTIIETDSRIYFYFYFTSITIRPNHNECRSVLEIIYIAGGGDPIGVYTYFVIYSFE